ncbi:MAG: carbohydrate ABC transporter permease [Ruminococcaceae bacterium]|nr:carbohydrate ABC transporter permease [Oscillospiraceae bacterium]
MKRRLSLTAGRIALTVLLSLLAVGVLLPTLLTVTASFMPQREIEYHYGTADNAADADRLALYPQNATAEQYTTSLLQTPHYLMRFFNSLWYTLPITLGQLTLASMAAYSLYRCRNRFRTGVYFLYVLLMLLPYQVTLLPHYLVADTLGLLGSRWAVVLSGIASPFAVFLLSRHMRQIPLAQVEAAMLDGADERRIFTRICLPQCRPTLWAVSMLIFAEYWNMIEQPLVLLEDPSTYPLSIFLSQIDRSQTGVAFAVAVLFMVPPLLLFGFGQRYFAAGFGAADEAVPRTRASRVFRTAVAVGAAAGLTVLWIFFGNTALHTRFTPQVTVTTPTAAIVNDTLYTRVLPREAIHTDTYGRYVMEVTTHTQDGTTVQYVDYEAVTVLHETDEWIALAEGGDWTTVVLSFDRLPPENSYVTVKNE